MAISVLIIDDHELIRLGLRQVIGANEDFTVVGEAATLAEGRKQIDLLQPDVIVLDLRLPDGDGATLAREARQRSAALGIVILTAATGDERLFEALESGASAFVPKGAPVEEVLAALRHAAASPRAFSASDLAEAMKRRMAPQGPQLSPREREVLGLLAQGMGVSAIAKHVYISESTAKTHISKLYDKLGASNRAQALMNALRLGFIRQDSERDQ